MCFLSYQGRNKKILTPFSSFLAWSAISEVECSCFCQRKLPLWTLQCWVFCIHPLHVWIALHTLLIAQLSGCVCMLTHKQISQRIAYLDLYFLIKCFLVSFLALFNPRQPNQLEIKISIIWNWVPDTGNFREPFSALTTIGSVSVQVTGQTPLLRFCTSGAKNNASVIVMFITKSRRFAFGKCLLLDYWN